jgi:hypothetical protein
MNKAELLVEDYSSAALFADILKPILGLHMLPRKYALLEVKVDAVLAQHLRIYLTLDLLDKLIYGITKYKVTLESRMSVQVQVHKQPLVLSIVLT